MVVDDMGRLDRKQAADLFRALCQWQRPQSMLATVEGLASGVVIAHPRTAFTKEAWIAAQSGILRKADRVRLVENDPPDFQLEIGSVIEDHEAVTVIEKGRRMAAEYRHGSRDRSGGTATDMRARSDGALVWLKEQTDRKAAKGYPPDTNLTVFLNVGGEFGIGFEEIVKGLPEATAGARRAFARVWVLFPDRIYCMDP